MSCFCVWPTELNYSSLPIMDGRLFTAARANFLAAIPPKKTTLPPLATVSCQWSLRELWGLTSWVTLSSRMKCWWAQSWACRADSHSSSGFFFFCCASSHHLALWSPSLAWMGWFCRPIEVQALHHHLFSALLLVVSVCVTTTHSSKRHLCRRLSIEVICGYKPEYLEGGFTTWPFWQTTVGGFLTKVLELPQPSALDRFIELVWAPSHGAWPPNQPQIDQLSL